MLTVNILATFFLKGGWSHSPLQVPTPNAHFFFFRNLRILRSTCCLWASLPACCYRICCLRFSRTRFLFDYDRQLPTASLLPLASSLPLMTRAVQLSCLQTTPQFTDLCHIPLSCYPESEGILDKLSHPLCCRPHIWCE